MKKFKIIDTWISTGLIGSFLIIAFFRGEHHFFDYLICSYLVIGGWQVISMLVHAYNGCFTGKKGFRYVYHWITFIFLITMPVGSFLILVFTAPFMAVIYAILCYDEVYVKMKRPLADLK